MPSGRAKRQPESSSLEFFLDRGLGRFDVAEMLRSHGHVAHVMAEVYPNGADQTMDDPDWMRDIDDRGWVALTKDASIVRAHRDDLESFEPADVLTRQFEADGPADGRTI